MKQMDAMYEKFTPRERVALVIEAIVRKDLNEADRLIDTCEQKNYRMPDARYSEGLRCVHTMALHARILLLQWQSAGMAVLALVHVYADKKSRKEKKAFSDACDRLLSIDASMRGTWFAWEQFCADVGVDADKAFALGWSEASEDFKMGIGASTMGIPPTEPCPDAYKYALGLFEAYLDRLKRYN